MHLIINTAYFYRKRELNASAYKCVVACNKCAFRDFTFQQEIGKVQKSNYFKTRGVLYEG